MEEAECVTRLCEKKVPSGKVRYWVSDGHGGGCFEMVTPEESNRRDQIIDREAFDEIDWE